MIPHRIKLASACIFLCLASLVSPARAANPDPLAMYRNAPQISVLTFGPGDAAFLRFGHNAIRVRDPVSKTDLVYNYGTFRFDSPFLILDFLTGRFKYWLSVSQTQPVIRHYIEENRDVREQLLNLSVRAEYEVAERLRVNALPQNREYLYDYYRDNCSTRIRDLLNDALKGLIKQRLSHKAKYTLRQDTLRAVADDFWLYLGLDIAMGSYIDQPETQYAEMFLPQKLEQGLASVSFAGVHGAFSLVKQKITHYESSRPDKIRRRPPDRTEAFLKGGSLVAVVFLFLAWESYRRRKLWAHALLSVLMGAVGLTLGLLGTLFLGLWAFTNHEVAFHNENILQCAPWAMGLAFATPGVLRGNPKRTYQAYLLVLAGLALAALGLLMKPLAFMNQDNYRIIALILPLWVGMFASMHLLKLKVRRDQEREKRHQQREDQSEPPPENTSDAPDEAPADAPTSQESRDDSDLALRAEHEEPLGTSNNSTAPNNEKSPSDADKEANSPALASDTEKSSRG